MTDRPNGGWDDYDGDWDTLEAAERDLIPCRGTGYSQIVDTETKEVVAYYEFTCSPIENGTNRRFPRWSTRAYELRPRWIKCKAIHGGNTDNWEWEEISTQ